MYSPSTATLLSSKMKVIMDNLNKILGNKGYFGKAIPQMTKFSCRINNVHKLKLYSPSTATFLSSKIYE